MPRQAERAAVPQADVITLPPNELQGLKKRLHRIAALALLLWGDSDCVNPVAYGEEFLRRLKNAELRILPGGHMLPHESPDAVARAVGDFLR